MSGQTEQFLREASNGNHACYAWLAAWVAFCHALDDLWDADKPRDLAGLTRTMAVALLEFGNNPFYQANRVAFEPLVLASARSWAESNTWPQPEQAKVLSGMYHEVIYHAATLTGGIDFAAALAVRHRGY